MKPALGKVLYAGLFCLVLPLLLAGWAVALERKLGALPAVSSAAGGGALAAAGLLLMGWAMWDLWRRGGGLPMNAFPPPRLVAGGAYAWVPHPIYAGFGAAVVGVSVATGSRAGFWVVSPVTILAMVALVIGYERIDLRRRFGSPQPRPWLARPPASAEAPTFSERVATVIMAFGPWLILYEVCVRLGAARHALNTMLPFESRWPVWPWTGVFYLGAYAWTVAAPFAARDRKALRAFTGTAAIGTGFIIWCFLVLPLIAAPRSIEGVSWIADLLRLDRFSDTPACSFPSFHAFWAFAVADLWTQRIGRPASFLASLAVAASCVTTGSHSVADVVVGWLVYRAAASRHVVWAALRSGTERIANSWHDWRVGPVRIINHGLYVATGTMLGLWLIGLLLGPHFAPAILVVSLCALLGAGLWGQWLEASSQLSRPFGYFGGIFGGCLGMVAVEIWRGEGWYVAGAFAVAAPLIQGIGRLRCLVQGCCHGRPTDDWLGIRYTQPHSRVCKLARLDGIPVHATPLYSILGVVVVFGVLARLWRGGADLALIFVVFFLLSTAARFMEEGYRGEPQTARWGGLAIYQWLAIGCLLAGMACSVLPAPLPPAWSGWSIAPLAYALPFGLLTGAAMGVDFPGSSQRMSRLA